MEEEKKLEITQKYTNIPKCPQKYPKTNLLPLGASGTSLVCPMAQNICTELSKAWQAPQHGAVSTHLELAEHIDEDAAVEHGLAVHGRDEVRDLLEGQATQLLHDLRRALGGESDQAHGDRHDHPRARRAWWAAPASAGPRRRGGTARRCRAPGAAAAWPGYRTSRGESGPGYQEGPKYHKD